MTEVERLIEELLLWRDRSGVPAELGRLIDRFAKADRRGEFDHLEYEPWDEIAIVADAGGPPATESPA